jgi:hypothetical protein
MERRWRATPPVKHIVGSMRGGAPASGSWGALLGAWGRSTDGASDDVLGGGLPGRRKGCALGKEHERHAQGRSGAARQRRGDGRGMAATTARQHGATAVRDGMVTGEEWRWRPRRGITGGQQSGNMG